MATDMVNRHIYFLESDAADNINWVPTVDNIILSALYTEGTEYVKLEMPTSYEVSGSTGITVKDSGGGSSFDERPNRRFYKMLAQGVETSTDNAERVCNFFMLDRHTSGAAATFKRYYAVVKKDTTNYVQFIDASSTLRDYCKGVVLKWKYKWHEDDNLVSTVYLDWRSVW